MSWQAEATLYIILQTIENMDIHRQLLAFVKHHCGDAPLPLN